jgi:hypothetical protein
MSPEQISSFTHQYINTLCLAPLNRSWIQTKKTRNLTSLSSPKSLSLFWNDRQLETSCNHFFRVGKPNNFVLCLPANVSVSEEKESARARADLEDDAWWARGGGGIWPVTLREAVVWNESESTFDHRFSSFSTPYLRVVFTERRGSD